MKNIIITQLDPREFDGIDIEVLDPATFAAAVPAEWSNYEKEYIPHLISARIQTLGLKKINVFIDSQISGEDKFLIASHILTSTSAAVFFFSQEENREIYGELDYNVLKNKGVKIFTKTDLDRILANADEVERVYKVFNDSFDYDFFAKNFQSSLEYDRHQATNEWAAIKLLLNHGKSLAQAESIFDFPKTVFFKQKLRSLNIQSSGLIANLSTPVADKITTQRSLLTTNHTGLARVLLIDDNAEKGWSHVIEELFSGVQVDVKYKYDDASSIPDFSIYDLILLDLRLPKDSSSAATDIQHGIDLIDQIKSSEDSLHIPLLIFTASQKSSTMEKVLKKGADDIFVKESLHLSEHESSMNYLDLITKLNYQIAKGKALGVYWKAIVKIKTQLISEITDIAPKILKSRIIERLEMFYGLLKKNYEQTSYNDQKFHFSSESLAYMTLWSILNEIQECYFEKDTGVSYTMILDAAGTSVPVTLDDWKIRAQTPDAYFVRIKPSFNEDIDEYGVRSQTTLSSFKEYFVKIDGKKTAPFFYMRAKFFKQKHDPRRTLSLQIAYLLLNKSQFSASTKINDYLRFVKESNVTRNTLYLTHGEDLNTSFHNDLERSKGLPGSAMANLFSVVSFLLTGDENII